MSRHVPTEAALNGNIKTDLESVGLTRGRALGVVLAGRLLPEDGLGPVFLLGFGGFGLDEALLLEHLLLLPPQILLLDQLPPRLFLFFAQAVFFGFPPSVGQTKKFTFPQFSLLVQH